MSLVQYHGEQSPSISKYLTEDGLVKDGPTSIYDPVLHLPLGMYNENDRMYDKWALRRLRGVGLERLLPWDLAIIPTKDKASHKKLFGGVVFNYLGDSYLIEGADKLKVITDPIDNVIMQQMFRVGHYCNLQNLVFYVSGQVFYTEGDNNAPVYTFIHEVTPWVNEIFERVGEEINLVERLEGIVSNVEGIGRPFVLGGSGQEN